MSNKLKAEISKFVVNKFLFTDGLFFLTFKEFLHPQKISVETEDGEVVDKEIWSGEFALKENKLKVVLANLAVAEEEDFAMILRFDDLPPYLLIVSEDISSVYFRHNNSWLECGVDVACRLVVGLEAFSSFVPKLRYDENTELFHLLNSHINPDEKKNT